MQQQELGLKSEQFLSSSATRTTRRASAATAAMIQGSGQSDKIQPQASYGYALAQGPEGRMEDFHVAQFKHVDGKEIGFFGIFDGHAGQDVALYLQEHLLENILAEGGIRLDPAGATRDGYLLTDGQILKAGLRGGSTAVTAMILENGNKLITANVGDARAVLCRNGKAVQLSVDHDSGRPIERANVEMKGGVVITMPGDVPRVDGQLAVARAFGDKSIKDHMSAKPDVADEIVDLDCEFLILASNGLWKCVGNQEAVDLVRDIVDPLAAASKLVKEAENRRIGDDISVIVIRFQEL